MLRHGRHIASLVGSSNMAAASLLFISQGILGHVVAQEYR